VLTGFLRQHLRPYRSSIAVIMLLQVVQTVAILLLPTLNALIIDNGIVKGAQEYIIRVGAVMALVTVVQVVVSIAAERIGARVSAGLGRDLRATVFGKVLTFAAREVGDFGTPSLMTRTVNDVKQAQTFALTIFDVALSTLILSVGGLTMALVRDLWLGLLLVLMFLVVVACIGSVLAKMYPLYDKLQVGLDRINQILREQITGVRVVRAFVRDRREHDRFTSANKKLYGPSLRIGRLMSTFPAVVMVVMNGFMAALIWFGGRRVDSGSLQLGSLSALLGYLSLIVLAMVLMIVVVTGASRAFVSIQRIKQVLDTDPTVREPARPLLADAAIGQLDLRGAEFGYPGAESPVLRGVDLVARLGETVAVVGGTGSGKSTLLSLVLRQFDVTGGSVRINGVDVRDIDADTLADLVGFVPQTAHLFSGTVRGNLHYGNPSATDDQLWHVLDVVQARDFVARMPDGLGSVIEQGGKNLSGGQRQRLSIARTLLRRPEIYLFDDCFSALDAGTEAKLRLALRRELVGCTVLLVSQRIGAIRDADRIVVLDEGRVAGVGTHRDLLRDNEIYREIVQSQPTRQEELDATVRQP
jgi:ATP-binding cassette, subfamily B, multidrug efflux pump